jgi:hypothetical protein
MRKTLCSLAGDQALRSLLRTLIETNFMAK